MPIHVEDLFCGTCRGYVHPFLEACPACGVQRSSRCGEVVAQPAGCLTPIASDPAVRNAARELTTKYGILVGRFAGTWNAGPQQADEAGGVDVAELLNAVAGTITYRAIGGPGGSMAAFDTALSVSPERLQLRDEHRAKVLVEIDPAFVLVAIPAATGPRAPDQWIDITVGDAVGRPAGTVPRADLVLTFGAADSVFELGIANRPGLFAAKARSDHYETLARWIGLHSAAAAERRWLEIGPAAYAAELARAVGGVGAAGPAVSEPAAVPGPLIPQGGPAASTAPRSSVRDALVELEAVRTAGLMTESEYETKRREILDRL